MPAASDSADSAALRARVAELEARLVAVAEAVGALHHDLSNPMAALSGNAELLRMLAEETTLDAEMQATIDDLVQAVEKLRDQLDRLRSLRLALRSGEPL